MLAVLLFILKIIGILLLVILGLLLTLLLLVLFVPVRYRIRASYKEEGTAAVKITWLLHLLSVSAVYDKTLEILIKVLGFPLFSGDKTEEQVEDELDLGDLDAEDIEEQVIDAAESLVDDAEHAAESAEHAEKSIDIAESVEHTERSLDAAERAEHTARSTADIKRGTGADGGAGSHTANADMAADGHEKSRKSTIFTKIRFWFASICDKLKTVKAKTAQIRDFITDPVNQETFRLIFRQIKALLHHILPRKVSADVVFGFDDPATTGQVLSLCTFLYVWYGDSLRITPVFDEKVLEADVDVKGRIRLGTMLVLGIRILLNKNFRILLRRFRMNGGL